MHIHKDSIVRSIDGYECHDENNPHDNEQIKENFNELHQQRNSTSLQIFYPVCKLCEIMSGLASLRE